MIYLAPIQGYTDRFYRASFNKSFNGIDKAFTPYISFHKGVPLKNKLNDILATANNPITVIPQVLTNKSEELIAFAKHTADLGYEEINLNLGCPYPMVAKKKLGVGLMAEYEMLQKLLDESLALIPNVLSLKFRLGYENPKEYIKLIELINNYPISELIFHPRTGKQLYKGDAQKDEIEILASLTKIPLVYNGDIFTKGDYDSFKTKHPNISKIMLGRGILSNPFLAEEIKGIENSRSKKERLREFHTNILAEFETRLNGSSHVLNKSLAFWEYFCHNFSDPRKAYKLIKKSKNMAAYHSAVETIFRKYH